MEKFSDSDRSVKSLVERIHRIFPIQPIIPVSEHLAAGRGDDWSRENINDVLGHRPWNKISAEDLFLCGYSELRAYLTRSAVAYYLPSLMANVLQSPEARSSRLKEVTSLMLLPTTPDYQDVWEYFGDGLFSDWGTEHFMSSTQELIKKIDFVHATYTPEQRECVACYVDVVESHGVTNPDAAFSALLRKFSDFWRR